MFCLCVWYAYVYECNSSINLLVINSFLVIVAQIKCVNFQCFFIMFVLITWIFTNAFFNSRHIKFVVNNLLLLIYYCVKWKYLNMLCFLRKHCNCDVILSNQTMGLFFMSCVKPFSNWITRKDKDTNCKSHKCNNLQPHHTFGNKNQNMFLWDAFFLKKHHTHCIFYHHVTVFLFFAKI